MRAIFGHLERLADLLPLHNRSAMHTILNSPCGDKSGFETEFVLAVNFAESSLLEVLAGIRPGLVSGVTHANQLLLVRLLLWADCCGPCLLSGV